MFKTSQLNLRMRIDNLTAFEDLQNEFKAVNYIEKIIKDPKSSRKENSCQNRIGKIKKNKEKLTKAKPKKVKSEESNINWRMCLLLKEPEKKVQIDNFICYIQ